MVISLFHIFIKSKYFSMHLQIFQTSFSDNSGS